MKNNKVNNDYLAIKAIAMMGGKSQPAELILEITNSLSFLKEFENGNNFMVVKIFVLIS